MWLTVFHRLLRILRPYKWSVVSLVLLGLLASLAEGVGIGLVIPFVDVAVSGVPLGEDAGPLIGILQGYAAWLDGPYQLLFLGLTIVALVVAKSLVTYGYAAASAWIKARCVHDLRCRLFERLLGMDYPRFAADDSGKYYNVVANETWRTTDALTTFFMMVIKGCTILVFGSLLLLLSWQLTCFAVVVVVVTALLLSKAVSVARRLGQVVVQANNQLADAILDMLGGMRTIRAFVREQDEQRRLEQASDRVRTTYLRMDLVSGLAQPLVELVYLPVFLVLIVLASMTSTGMATLVAFLLLMYRLIPYVKEFEHNRVLLAGCVGSLTAVDELLQSEAPPARAAERKFSKLADRINFDNVGFRYGPRGGEVGFALDKVSFEIPCGKTVALVGPSGAGKSTLVNLLYGFHQPTAGQILVDEVPLETIQPASWRQALAFAGQDAVLFRGTVAENIRFARPDASQEEVLAAARAADAEAFIDALPSGFQTRVGRGGYGLSGGQCQRIALARALLVEPQLLILDETTNAVDNISERTLQEMLRSLSGRVTVLIIAHRMHTIRHADSVVVLEEGGVVEQGPPVQLLENRSAFSELFRAEAEGLADFG